MYLLVKLIESLRFDLRELQQYQTYYKEDELLEKLDIKVLQALEQAIALREKLIEIARLERAYKMDA